MTIHKARQFSVDTKGAYVMELIDDLGSPILFNRTMIGEKVRGGSHVCYPYFGPDLAGVMPQHGFGRVVEWRIETFGDREIVCDYEEQTDDFFKGLYARITYRLDEAGSTFTTSLQVENRSNQLRAVMPGFHPYFAVDPQDVSLNGQKINVSDFEPFQLYPDRSSMELKTLGRTVTVTSPNMNQMVAWWGGEGDYL